MDALLSRAILTALIAYGLGNLNGAIIISRALYRKDVRTEGSKNGGLTNFMRVFGKKAAPLVILVDAGKALCAAWLGGLLLRNYTTVEFGRALGMLCVVIGHMFPALFHFHGGKGILSGVSAVFLLDWHIGLILLGLFFFILLLTRYVSLGSILGAALCPVLAQLFVGQLPVTLLCALAGALMIFMHRSNITRLLNGTENKFSF